MKQIWIRPSAMNWKMQFIKTIVHSLRSMALLETIKKNVKEIGGEWLDTHLDLKEVESSTIKLSSMDIHFSALGSYEDKSIKKPFSYLIHDIPVIQEPVYKRITFSMPRLFYLDGER